MSGTCTCSICLHEVIPGPSEAGGTGSVNLSCTHTFHFRCITEWFDRQEKSTCPLCRKTMSTIEDLPPKQTQAPSPLEEHAIFTREELDTLLKRLGGSGVTDNMDFIGAANENDTACLSRTEFDFLCWGNGASSLSTEEWESWCDDDTRQHTYSPTAIVSLTRAEVTQLIQEHGAVGTPEEFLGTDSAEEFSISITELANRMDIMGGAPLSEADVFVLTHGQLGQPSPQVPLAITIFHDGERVVEIKHTEEVAEGSSVDV